MNKTLAIASLEKEVGKSTLALNLASSLSKIEDMQVFLIDLDFYNAGATKILDLQELPFGIPNLAVDNISFRNASYLHPSGFNFVPNFKTSVNYSAAALKRNIGQLKDQSSLVLLDSNSGKGLFGSLESAEDFIIVSSLSKEGLQLVSQLITIIENNNKNILGIVFNKTGSNLIGKSSHSLSVQDKEKIESWLGKPILGAIPHHDLIHKANTKTHPATYLYPSSAAAQPFAQLSLELLKLYDYIAVKN